jgi:hypothetical protein
MLIESFGNHGFLLLIDRATLMRRYRLQALIISVRSWELAWRGTHSWRLLHGCGSNSRELWLVLTYHASKGEALSSFQDRSYSLEKKGQHFPSILNGLNGIWHLEVFIHLLPSRAKWISSFQSNRARPSGLLTMILLLRTRRDLRNGEIGKILHDSKAHINGELK